MADNIKEKSKEAKETIERLRKIYRLINAASAASIIGLIVTFFLMNGQLILGNWLKVSKVPKLTTPEIIMLGCLDLLILSIGLIIFTIFSITIEAFAHPFNFWKTLGGGIWDSFKGFFD